MYIHSSEKLFPALLTDSTCHGGVAGNMEDAVADQFSKQILISSPYTQEKGKGTEA